MKIKILIIVISLMILSCAENQKSTGESEPLIEGFWNRLGTIRYVNNIEVDTNLIKDRETIGLNK